MPQPDPARRSETSRRAVLTAAFELVQEVSYSRVTIEAIAARAGVGKQTIYRWWPSKASILFDAFLQLSASAEGQGPELPDTGDLHRDLSGVLRATVAELTDPRMDAPMRALAVEIAQDPELARAYHERLDGPLREAKKRRLQSAQRAGQVREGLDLDVAVDLVWGPVLSRWLQHAGPLTEDYVDSTLAAALDGLRP